MQERIDIDYYSDVLCVWAWIAQPRLEELSRQWADRISVKYHFVDIFGDAHKKIHNSWGEQDGYEKFADHVRHSAKPFGESFVHPDLWRTVRPSSSSQAHLLLRAVGLVADEERLASVALRIRQAFFCDARDISDMELLLDLAEQEQVDRSSLSACLRDGRAIAALSSDLRAAAEMNVRGSPTWILNNGRQVLFGNVGYRILNANIEELLKSPGDEASWC